MEETALARLQSELKETEAALLRLDSRESGEAEALQVSRRLHGADLAGIANARQWVLNERKRLRFSRADCHRRIDLQNASLIEAQRKVRLLQRLRERRQAAWIHEQNRSLEERAAESAIGSWRRDITS